MAPLDQLEKCRKPDYRHLEGGSRRCDEMSFLFHTSGSVGDLGGQPPRSTRPRATELTRIIFPEGSCGIGCEVPREREARLKRCNSLGIRYNPDLPHQESLGGWSWNGTRTRSGGWNGPGTWGWSIPLPSRSTAARQSGSGKPCRRTSPG